MKHLAARILHAAMLLLAAAPCLALFPCQARASEPVGKERHLLYVAAPGIRNYLEFGGAGILVFDMDNGHKFVKRIETPASKIEK